MGLLDSYESENIAALDDLQRRPPTPRAQPAKFSAWNLLTAVPRGVTVAGMETGAMVPDIAEGIGNAFTRATVDLLPEPRGGGGDEFRKREKERAQGASSVEGDVIRQASRDFMPDAQTAHGAEQAVFGFARFGTKAVTSVALAGPAAGAAIVATDEGLTAADELRQQGVDLETRTKVGAVTGVLSGVGAVLPVAGKTAAQTAALVVAGGPASFIAQQAATRQILQDADYTKLADQIDPLDPVGLAVSTLVPAGFGVWAMRGMRKGSAKAGEPVRNPEQLPPEAAPVQDAAQPEPARPTRDQVDAARVEMLTQHVESARLTPPEDAAGARAHDEAMTRAMDQIARGERVEVSDVAPVPFLTSPSGVEFKSGADGFVSANTDVGTVGGHVRGDALHITFAEVAQESQGKGEGVRLYSSLVDKALAEGLRVFSDSTVEAAAVRVYESLKRRGYDVRRLEGGEIDGAAFGKGAKEPAFEIAAGPKRAPDASARPQSFDAWSSQIGQAASEARAAASKESANVQDAPQARADAPATGERQPAQATQPQAADARGVAPARAAEQGGGVPRAGGGAAEASVVAARLAEVSQQFPDLTVQMDGMDAPVKLSEFLAQVQREAMEGTDDALGGNDAPLMQVAASCFLLNGA